MDNDAIIPKINELKIMPLSITSNVSDLEISALSFISPSQRSETSEMKQIEDMEIYADIH